MVAAFMCYYSKVTVFQPQNSAVDANKGLCVFVSIFCCLAAMTVLCLAIIVLDVKQVWTTLLTITHIQVTNCYTDEILRVWVYSRANTLFGKSMRYKIQASDLY